ncbi:hypothetical protein DFH08DRAFT_895011 [Mycena albidolilacea]|uniref:Secreted protein n=1 Tax=Mycena albidolilacea TaxID=1033008 RepID=A0AAD6ZAE9_9AGAR|nr:hypothetical protein DFH08DRAFT_895011 [Mycena albidolilacea]
MGLCHLMLVAGASLVFSRLLSLLASSCCPRLPCHPLLTVRAVLSFARPKPCFALPHSAAAPATTPRHSAPPLVTPRRLVCARELVFCITYLPPDHVFGAKGR